MYRIKSQLCEVFDCTGHQLENNGVLEEFNAWHRANPDQRISHSLEYGEMINGKFAEKFCAFYKSRIRHGMANNPLFCCTSLN